MDRNIRFRYYKLEKQHKFKNRWHSDGEFDFLAWLNGIKKYKKEMVTIELKDTKARVEKIRYYEKEQLWVLRFMKLRDENIPMIAKENTEAEDIALEDDEYIGEDLYVLYDETCGLAMIQSNRFSLGTARLAEFMAKTYSDEVDIRVKIKPIIKDIDLRKYKKKSYKTIELGFANIIADVPSSKSPLSVIMNSYRKFHALSGHISISLGRTKENTLNIEEVDNLLEEIGEYDNVVSAKLRIKDDDAEHTELIDLFDNIAQDTILFKVEKRSSLWV